MTPVSYLRSIVLALVVAAPQPGLAERPALLVADGLPWKSTAPDGRKMNITFFPDGTAKMKMGIISRNLTWQETEDGICLIGTPRGDACMRLEPTAGGFVGYKGETQMMTLTR
jgi:hypothetical protein